MDRLVNYSSEDEHEQDLRDFRKRAHGAPTKLTQRRRSGDASSSGSSPTRTAPSPNRERKSSSGVSGRPDRTDNGHHLERSKDEKKERSKYRSPTPHKDQNRPSARYNRDEIRKDNERKINRESRNYRSNKERSDNDGNDRYRRDSNRPPKENERNYSSRHAVPNRDKERHYGHHHYSRDEDVSSRHNRRRDDHHKSDRRSGRRRSSRSRSRSRSRTRSPTGGHHRQKRSHHRPRSRSPSPTQRGANKAPLEKARLSALEMERKLEKTKDNEEALDPTVPARTIEAVTSLPLSPNAPKQPNVIAVAPIVPTSSSAAPSSEPAVIQLPSYYNPSVINPNKYAEQVQKRKLLWSSKKTESTTAKWGSAQFSQDTDGKVASKFMRLMGIKDPEATKVQVDVDKPTAAPDVKSREAMFSNMEQQYEVARQVTHTMRGVGLGFGSQSRPF